MTDTLRKSPYDLDREQELWTFQDAVEHVCDVFRVSRTSSAREFRHAKRAVLESYRELPNLHNWGCFRRSKVINTVAEYTTGTIAYDHTGGASERLVTLTDGTLPDWTEFGQIVIDGVTYDVEQKLSSTTLTLPERTNPGADVTAGESYTLYRSRYPLPLDYRRNGQVFQATDDYAMVPVTPEVMHAHVAYDSTTGASPGLVSIVEDPSYIGGVLSMQFASPPSEAKAYVFIYERKPRALRTEKYSTGTLSGTTTTLTGDGTAWSSDHVGAILRIGADTTNEPTSIVGSDFSSGERYASQRVIMTIASTTSLTVDAAPDAEAVADTKYTISDPIDLNYDVMLNAFLRLCEWKFSSLSNRDDQDKRQGRWMHSLLLAKDADRRFTEIQSANLSTAQWGPSAGDISPLG